MKLACVVHRFGADIAGGSEGHCRAIAERLAADHDVTVLTTTARDHVTWASAYPDGVTADGPLRVHRFPVVRQRSLHRFADISERVFGGRHGEAEEMEWFRENGPDSPALLQYLADRGRDYDRVLFWAFRYATTFFGVPHVADRAILLPTAEEDPVMGFRALEAFFKRPAGMLFLTPEERSLVAGRAFADCPRSDIIGTGLDPVAAPASASPLQAIGIEGRFVLYLGRVDPNKGCRTLISHFIASQDALGVPVTLVLAGPTNMPIPQHPRVRALGYVSDDIREALLSNAAALVMPSPYESLSIALLEGWNHGVPAIVNAQCAVLRGQALRSNGALIYQNAGEFAAGLRYLLTHDDDARQLGQQGLAYVDREYRWPGVMEKIERFLQLGMRI